MPVKVTIYADNALYLGELLSQSLEKPTQRESFEASGFSVLRNEGLQDISATLETGFEKRCQLSIIINTAVSYDDTVGYIKIDKFSDRTYEAFMQALEPLLKKGMKSLVIDLRGNGGGLLSEAVAIADELLAGNKLIVYTEGLHAPRVDYYSHRKERNI